MKIPFNRPFLTGKETSYIKDAVNDGKISGNGKYTKKCQSFFEERYNFKKCLLTNSCTSALEMASILINIEHGDEVILPSFTFVSTANAFLLRGAKLIFADSSPNHPNIDVNKISSLISFKTKAIVVVHYAGNACDMDEIMKLANEHNIFVIEDAAQSIDGLYKGKPLGGIGHLSAFSFHETKNIISGEGGMLVINDERFIERSEIVWEKGTNRSAFFRGEIDKYNWVDIGSSFLPSEIVSAFLYAQLEQLNYIQSKRKLIWQIYFDQISKIDKLTSKLPEIPNYSSNNAHMFYLVCEDYDQRTKLIQNLNRKGIGAVFHYLPLHSSPFFDDKHDGRKLENCDKFSSCLLRLPFYIDLKQSMQQRVINSISDFYGV